MYNTSDMELKWSKLLESLVEQSDLTTKGGSGMQEDSTLLKLSRLMNNTLAHRPNTRLPIVCTDGFSVSIQVGEDYY